MKKFIALLIAVLLFSVALISCAESDYDKALNLIENEEYEEAIRF